MNPSSISLTDRSPDEALIPIKSMATWLVISESTAWERVKNDPDFPKPIRLSSKCTRFRVGDVRAYIAEKAKPIRPLRKRNLESRAAQ